MANSRSYEIFFECVKCLTFHLIILLQRNGMETTQWSITGGGITSLSIEADSFAGFDAYDACCYCQWDGAPASLSQTYYVSLDGVDASSQSVRSLKVCRYSASILNV